MVNVDQSVRLLKLFWWLLQDGQEGVSFEYLRRDPNEITVKASLYNIQQVIDWLPPMSQDQPNSKSFLNVWRLNSAVAM